MSVEVDPAAGDAVLSAWLAWERLSEAKSLGSFCDAFNDLSNAMSDVSSWLPGYNIETGRVEGCDDE